MQPNGDASDSAHDAVTDATGVHDEAVTTAPPLGDSGASEGAQDAVADAGGAHDDTEADRTLTSGNVSKHTADSDEADTSDSAISSEAPLDARWMTQPTTTWMRMSFPPTVTDRAELVAAPRDIDGRLTIKKHNMARRSGHEPPSHRSDRPAPRAKPRHPDSERRPSRGPTSDSRRGESNTPWAQSGSRRSGPSRGRAETSSGRSGPRCARCRAWRRPRLHRGPPGADRGRDSRRARTRCRDRPLGDPRRAGAGR